MYWPPTNFGLRFTSFCTTAVARSLPEETLGWLEQKNLAQRIWYTRGLSFARPKVEDGTVRLQLHPSGEPSD